MSSLIQYDSLVLTDEIHDLVASEPNRIPIAAVAKRHGAIVTDLPTIGERTIALKGTLYGRDFDVTDPAAGAIARRDSIAASMRLFNKKLYLDSSKFLNAYPQSFNWSYRAGSSGRVIDYAMNFICPDPFYYTSDVETSQTVQLLNSDPSESGVAGSKIKNAVITNTGSGYTFIKVTVTCRAGTGALSRCRVVNQTIPLPEAGMPYRDWVYSNVVTSPDSLVVDSNEFTVINNSIFLDPDDLEHWQGIWLWLEPGANTIQVAGTPEADYLFEWLPRNY